LSPDGDSPPPVSLSYRMLECFSRTYLLFSQRKCDILPVGNQKGSAMTLEIKPHTWRSPQRGGSVVKSLRRLLMRLCSLAPRRRQEERLREEIEEHLALQTADHVRAGLGPIEARRQAMLKFGGVEAMKEDYRAERGLVFIENLLRDLLHGLRML